jgi:hypothetical protein
MNRSAGIEYTRSTRQVSDPCGNFGRSRKPLRTERVPGLIQPFQPAVRPA